MDEPTLNGTKEAAPPTEGFIFSSRLEFVVLRVFFIQTKIAWYFESERMMAFRYLQNKPNSNMKIFVQAKPEAREEKVEKVDLPEDRPNEQHFVVAVKEPPRQGRANQAIAQALANYFKISRSRVQLVSGFASRRKMFEIMF